MGNTGIVFSPDAVAMIYAIFGMGALSFCMMIWMTVARTIAMNRLDIDTRAAKRTIELKALLPYSANRVADNYNHLFEAPTVFYAVTLSIVVIGWADPLHAACAWAFLVFRTGHSIIQATINHVPLRIWLYAFSWLALATMIARSVFSAISAT